MNYKKQIKPNYTLHLINTDRFKEILISFKFTKPYEKEEAAYLKLLERVAPTNGTKKYKKIKDISRELESLYRSSISSKFYAVSKNMTLDLSIRMVNPKYVDMDLYKNVFNMFKEIVLNPNIKNGKWDEDNFNIEKENLIKVISNIKDSPEQYGRLKFESDFFKGTIFEENNYTNLELFKNLENEKLYQTYLSLFNDYKIDVVVCGNFIEEIVMTEVEDFLKTFKQNDQTIKNLYIDMNKKKIEENKESIGNSQSNLFVGCTVKGITKEESDYILMLYNTILGSMNNSVLFVNVREKNSLCYHIGSLINKYTNTILIESGINKKNYEKAMKLINESLESMKDVNVVNKLITNAKKTLEIAYNDFYDNIFKIVNYYYLNELSYIPSVEERRQRVRIATAEEICELANKVEIKNIFLLEGSLNEEN